MISVYSASLAKAKEYYISNKDSLHDLSHSQRVAENAKDIARALNYPDLDFLELCAFWHDVARTVDKEPHEEEGAIMAQDDLLARGCSPDESRRIYEAIRFHKSTAKPETTEGKIIRDSDKLDIYSPIRWRQAKDSGWKQEYADDLEKTLQNLTRYPDVFTYDFSKQEFKERLPEFLKIAHELQQ